jgi:hypothetical protein
MRVCHALIFSFLCVPLCGGAMAQSAGRDDVLTMHASRERTGWFSHQAKLTPGAIESGHFGRLWESPQLDGFGNYPARLYASPLYVDGITIRTPEHKGTFRVVVAATSTGYVYAINAARTSGVVPGAILWKAHLDAPCILFWDGSAMGILGTPVIDKARKHLYVADCASQGSFKVYALDLSTGAVMDGWPVSIAEKTLEQAGIDQNPQPRSAPPPAPWKPRRFSIQRGALNLSPDDRYLYVTIGQGRGWVVAVDTQAKAVASAFSSTPLATDSIGGVWASTGVSIDARGEVYAVTGASFGEPHAPPFHNWAQSVLEFAPLTRSDPRLTLAGVYTPFNYCRTEAVDADLGSSGAAILPAPDGQPQNQNHLLLAIGGKQGNAYLLGPSSFNAPGTERQPCSTDSASDRSLLAPEPQPQFGAPGPINVFGPYSDADGALDSAKNRATPAYFRDAVGDEYVFLTGSAKDPKDVDVSVAPGLVRLKLYRPLGRPPFLRIDKRAMGLVLQNPGPAVVSSNGGRDGVVWMLDENSPRMTRLVGPKEPRPVLYAIDARTLKVLWKTRPGELQTSGKYNEPAVARGTVFVGTDRIAAFGLGASMTSAQTPFQPPAAEQAAPMAPVAQGPVAQSAADQTRSLSELPAGPARNLTAKTCLVCHSAEPIARRRLSLTGWRRVVDEMVEIGAQVDEKQKVAIVGYLSKTFPAIDTTAKPTPSKRP